MYELHCSFLYAEGSRTYTYSLTHGRGYNYSSQWVRHSLVLRPHPKEREPSAFWGLFLNSNAPIKFVPCSLHVINMWHHAIANYCCAWEWWMHCHDNDMTCCILCTPKSARCIPFPFPPWGQGLGTRLSETESLDRWHMLYVMLLLFQYG